MTRAWTPYEAKAYIYLTADCKQESSKILDYIDKCTAKIVEQKPPGTAPYAKLI